MWGKKRSVSLACVTPIADRPRREKNSSRFFCFQNRWKKMTLSYREKTSDRCEWSLIHQSISSRRTVSPCDPSSASRTSSKNVRKRSSVWKCSRRRLDNSQQMFRNESERKTMKRHLLSRSLYRLRSLAKDLFVLCRGVILLKSKSFFVSLPSEFDAEVEEEMVTRRWKMCMCIRDSVCDDQWNIIY